jgi:hypothetical protein
MNGFTPFAVFGCFVAVQFVGIASACVARCCVGTRQETLGQRLFLLAMLLIGVATMVALAVWPGCWLACSATLAFMLLMVVYNFRDGREEATW